MRLKKWLSLFCITALITAGIPIVLGNTIAEAAKVETAKTKTTKDGMVSIAK